MKILCISCCRQSLRLWNWEKEPRGLDAINLWTRNHFIHLHWNWFSHSSQACVLCHLLFLNFPHVPFSLYRSEHCSSGAVRFLCKTQTCAGHSYKIHYLYTIVKDVEFGVKLIQLSMKFDRSILAIARKSELCCNHGAVQLLYCLFFLLEIRRSNKRVTLLRYSSFL